MGQKMCTAGVCWGWGTMEMDGRWRRKSRDRQEVEKQKECGRAIEKLAEGGRAMRDAGKLCEQAKWIGKD